MPSQTNQAPYFAAFVAGSCRIIVAGTAASKRSWIRELEPERIALGEGLEDGCGELFQLSVLSVRLGDQVVPGGHRPDAVLERILELRGMEAGQRPVASGHRPAAAFFD